ncbi:uncharacterized protein PG986_001679 [Apiospora aurea]|uniref:Methyltransferase type 11 domain-containing protein n=1 Tax=Apiospora aurea TaxID=335848 RepID=A0ABR1QXH5_9PEZI
MFDVLWTDPNRELVGERKIRKELEAQSRDKEKKKTDISRNSTSASSSASSERSFGLFSSKSRKKASAPSKPATQSLSSPQTPADEPKDQRTSGYGVRALLSHEDDSAVTVKPASSSNVTRDSVPEALDGSLSLSSRETLESVNSKWTQPSLVTSTTLSAASQRDSTSTKSEHLIQALGPSSFVTKSTEITVSVRNSNPDVGQLVSEVQISSDGVKAETPPLPEVPEEGVPRPFDNSGPYLLSPQTPPPEYRSAASLYTSGWNGTDQLGNPDAWKPPHEWDCTSTRDLSSSSLEHRVQSPPPGDGIHYLLPGLSALQREVRIMAAAGPELILANLKAGMGDATDAMVYKELEMNKKRWMFSALHQGEGYASLDLTIPLRDLQSTSRPPKVLAIYETQASASFLAALHPTMTISHLSQNPIYPSLFPNVQPILVPAISPTAASRPLPPKLYSAVTCLSMPALFASAEIPPFLRHIHRCLAPKGALHLTIIDPQPVSASMGPLLRQWLFEKLLINLEQSSRTTYPSETLPAWLGLGRLRGKGSTIVTVSVPAIPEGLDKIEGVKKQSSIKTELRCLVMRMLWQEVWGSFVRANRWWWEERDIVTECIELGTYWQHSHIVAVKEDR